ncbi:MAG: putative lipid II flippase FtsW [Patescibacteria group bacterium]
MSLLTRAKAHAPDYWFLASVGILLVVGLIVLASASAPVGFERFGDKYFFVKRQLLFGVLPGLALFALASWLDYHWMRRYLWGWYALTIVLLLLSFVPGIGQTINGAQSWIHVGNFSLQPSEIAKGTFAVFMALWLEGRGRFGMVRFVQDFLVFVGLMTVPAAILMRQPDTGTMMIMVGMAFVLLVAARSKLSHIVTLLAVGAALVAIMIASAPYRAERINTFLHPELDPQGVGYQINQAFLAVGSGGWFGVGYGNSRQKFQYLPEVSTDSIFAVFAEEMGFVVSSIFLVLVLTLFVRALHIARYSPDPFGMYLAVALAAWFGCQAFINIGAMLGLLPLTGVPLPLVSHGGTALLVQLGALGVLTNISRQTRATV